MQFKPMLLAVFASGCLIAASPNLAHAAKWHQGVPSVFKNRGPWRLNGVKKNGNHHATPYYTYTTALGTGGWSLTKGLLNSHKQFVNQFSDTYVVNHQRYQALGKQTYLVTNAARHFTYKVKLNGTTSLSLWINQKWIGKFHQIQSTDYFIS